MAHARTIKWAKEVGDEYGMSEETVLAILDSFLPKYSQRMSALIATKRFVKDYKEGVESKWIQNLE